MKTIATLLMMLALCASAFAADIDGTWTGNLPTANGDLPVTFNFKADGAKLTGSTMNFDGSPLNISDGKVEGNNITFKITFDFGGMPFVLNYKGVVSAAELKITAEAAELPMPIELLLKKAAATPAATPAPAAR